MLATLPDLSQGHGESEEMSVTNARERGRIPEVFIKTLEAEVSTGHCAHLSLSRV